METFTVNGRKVKAREADFNFLCDLGENGIEMSDIGKKPLNAIRQDVAFCMGGSADVAGSEINQHVLNGGDFEEILNVFREKMEESDFFRALNQTTATESTATPKKNTNKNAAEASE